MKKLFTLFLMTIFITNSCSDEDSLINDNSQEKLVINDVVNQIIEQGHNLDDIKELKDYYLVEDDILFSKNIEDYKKTNAKQANTHNLVSSGDNRVIRVRLDNSLMSWYSAFDEALVKWNSAGSGITFVSDQTGFGDYDIIVKADGGSLPNLTIAAAGFPTNTGKAYNEILVNTNFNNNYQVSESQKIYNLVHELGHCIGFRHTNWYSSGEGAGSVGANQIPGSPTSDSNSVMNGGTALNSWKGFSNWDIFSVKYLYPNTGCKFKIVTAKEVCAFDAFGDIGFYNTILMGDYGNDDLGVWSTDNPKIVVKKGFRSAKFGISSNLLGTNWTSVEGNLIYTNGSCIKTFKVKFNNCINYNLND
ncbi:MULTISPECIES: M57 family metalloprotease [Empedobacter]|uniref:Dual-action HEIGH metallo-peptidase n=1 Tax=Empedobacter falsenii TaxID=343874 RepID=A0A376J292_9FLAO|nr:MULTISPECIES: M57 family metalloprotease [Empedobacter]RRT94047.1 hypothetical protein EGI89_01385 [Empedobacter falsenii]RRT94241.1 hypothetical protein EGI88_01390 [Empedobacter falsenii]STE54782.1 Dual-action HEIGH metallo-peptidase [Empedobacter falsenii]